MFVLFWFVAIMAVVIGIVMLAGGMTLMDRLDEVIDSVCAWIAAWRAKRECRRFMRSQVRATMRKASLRQRVLMRRLYIDGADEDVMKLAADQQFTQASVTLGLQARVALKYPKKSPANELAVADWMNRNAPESMGIRQRARVFPLAIKLAFVRSKSELEANILGDWLAPQTEYAK